MEFVRLFIEAASESLLFLTFSLAMLVVLATTLHGIYFYFRFQRNLDKELMGREYCDTGLLHGVVIRQGLYGMAVMFPAYWRFVPSIDRSKIVIIKGRVRTHLWWHQLFAMAGATLFIATVVIDLATEGF